MEQIRLFGRIMYGLNFGIRETWYIILGKGVCLFGNQSQNNWLFVWEKVKIDFYFILDIRKERNVLNVKD